VRLGLNASYGCEGIEFQDGLLSVKDDDKPY